MAYSNYTTFTIESDNVSGTANLTNFPVLISTTLDGTSGEADLRTAGNGGNIQNTDSSGGASGGLTVPADLAFYDDEDQTTKLDHEFIDYNASTGLIKVWVRVPTVDYNNDTAIYCFYNDSSITTSQENIGGVWETNYKGVWHLQESSGTRYDSSGNGNHLTDNNTVTSGTGKIGTGADFELTNSEYLSITDASQTGLDFANDITWTGWVNIEQLPSTAGSAFAIFNKDISAYLFQVEHSGAGQDKLRCYYSGNGTQFTNLVTDGVIFSAGDVGNWVHLSIHLDSSAQSMSVYKNTSNQPASYLSGAQTSLYNNTNAFNLGGTNYYDGLMESVRVYDGLLTQDWITTEYNNQNSPSTFIQNGLEFSNSNLVQNGNLEEASTGWSFDADFTRSEADSYTGGWSIAHSSTSGYAQARSNEMTVTSSATYTITFWYKVTVNSGSAPQLNVYTTNFGFNDSVHSATLSDTAGAWTQYSSTFDASATSTSAWVNIKNNGGNVTAYYDDFEVVYDSGPPSGPSIFGDQGLIVGAS